MTASCAGLLIAAPGPRYLILQRNDRDEWEGPGGHIERGETPEQAARREASEEIGWAPSGPLTEIDHNQHAGVDYRLFLCRVQRSFAPPALNHEHTDWGWFSPDDLPDATHPELARVIRSQIHAAEHGYSKPYNLAEFNGAKQRRGGWVNTDQPDHDSFNPRAQPYYDRTVPLDTRQGGEITVDHLEELADQGMPEEAIDAARVSTRERNRLPESAFAVPAKRKLLITDEDHTRLAWDMVNRTQGLTSAEKAEARRRILRRAHQLGIDTDEWNIHAATLELTIDAMSVMVPDVKGHPNRHPFSGIVTRIGQPSDKAPGGSMGKRVILTPEAVEAAIPSLLMMGVDYSHDFNGHDPERKIGVISEAKAKGDALHIKGFFYAADFPHVVQEIVANRRQLGWSYELIVNPGGSQVAGDFLVVTDFVFTGAAVLRKDAAAYSTTTLAAASEDQAMAEHEADVKVMQKIHELEKEIEELKRDQKKDMREDSEMLERGERLKRRARHEAARDEYRKELDSKGRRERAAEDEDEDEIEARRRRRHEAAEDEDEDYQDEYVKAKRRRQEASAARSRTMHGHLRALRHRAIDIASKGLPEEAKELHDLADKIEHSHFGMDTPDDGEYRDEKEFFYDQPIKKPHGMEPAYDDLPDIHAGSARPQRRSLSAAEFMGNPRTAGDPASTAAAQIAALDAQLAAGGISGVDSIKAKLAAARNR